MNRKTFLYAAALLGVWSLSGIPAQQAGNSASASPRKARTIVILRNTHWARVKVEARQGNFQNPMQNRSLGSKVLKRGEAWTIETGRQDLFYRRDADPDHPNGRMNDWHHRPTYNKDATYTENI